MASYDYIQESFAAGILSPSYIGRRDQELYSAGLADADNFFVDVKGGIVSRQGTEFKQDLGVLNNVRLKRYRVNSDLEGNDCLLVFTAEKLEIFKSGVLQRTLTTPYAADELDRLHFYQFQDELVVTSHRHLPWVFDGEKFFKQRIGGKAASNSLVTMEAAYGTGDGGIIYGVSGIDEDGAESAISGYVLVENFGGFSDANVVLGWSDISGAQSYRLYRSAHYPSGNTLTLEAQLGYLTDVEDAIAGYVDSGAPATFEIQPTFPYTPFENGAVQGFNITERGSGYSATGATLTGGSGSGLLAVPIVNGDGQVIGARIIRQGRGYADGDVITFKQTGVSAEDEATATLRVSDANAPPQAVTRFRQRWLFAGTEKRPVTVYASRTGALEFHHTPTPDPAGSFELTLDAQERNPIRHLVSVQAGMFIFTSENVWLFSGNSAEDAFADPQQFKGASDVEPLVIEDSVLYVERNGRSVRYVRQAQQQNTFASVDVGHVSDHLFTIDNQIVRWTYAEAPNKLVWAVRQDGSMLSFTLSNEQRISAWTRHSTLGEFKDIEAVQEGTEDAVYVVVERNGRYLLERAREFMRSDLESLWSLDSAVEFKGNVVVGDSELSFERVGTDTIQVSGYDFSGSVNHILRFGRSVARIENARGGARLLIDELEFVPQFSDTLESRTTPEYLEKRKLRSFSTWTLTESVNELTGLEHLNGRIVEVFADGNVAASLGPNAESERVRVVDGRIRLAVPASQVVVGLPFDAYIELLPVRQLMLPTGQLNVNWGLSTVTKNLTVFHYQSRGIAASTDFADKDVFTIQKLRERTTEPPGSPIKLRTRPASGPIRPGILGVDNRVRIYLAGPLKLTIYGYVLGVEAEPNALPVYREG